VLSMDASVGCLSKIFSNGRNVSLYGHLVVQWSPLQTRQTILLLCNFLTCSPTDSCCCSSTSKFYACVISICTCKYYYNIPCSRPALKILLPQAT
jgi:hypothetical protein